MRTNRTPFCDAVCMVSAAKNEDASGHYTKELKGKTILCSVCDGVGWTEYYNAAKAGIQLDITVELWPEDYNGEKHLCYDGKLYDIKRTFPSGHGTLFLSCAEVER